MNYGILIPISDSYAITGTRPDIADQNTIKNVKVDFFKGCYCY